MPNKPPSVPDLDRYLAEARTLRAKPILVKDPGGVNGYSTLMSNGKPAVRSWREIAAVLKQRGFGTMGAGALAKAMRQDEPRRGTTIRITIKKETR